MNKKLYKVEEGKMICGVCTGLAVYFNVDPTLIRLAFALLTIMGGCGILAYILAAIIIPDQNRLP